MRERFDVMGGLDLAFQCIPPILRHTLLPDTDLHFPDQATRTWKNTIKCTYIIYRPSSEATCFVLSFSEEESHSTTGQRPRRHSHACKNTQVLEKIQKVEPINQLLRAQLRVAINFEMFIFDQQSKLTCGLWESKLGIVRERERWLASFYLGSGCLRTQGASMCKQMIIKTHYAA